MKTIKTIISIFLISISLTSCSDNDENNEIDPLTELNMLTSLQANTHTLELYSAQSQFTVGYNELFIRIKDASDMYISDATISWNPVMHMTSMMHSCPKSEVSKTDDASVYSGFIIFQMPGNDTEYWDLTINYTVNGESYTVTEQIEVKAPLDGMQRVSVFTGSDNARYILAMMPLEPKVAVNDFSALLYKMESMMVFSPVINQTIALDPRMPSMGNHSSPNNVDLTYNTTEKMYEGKLALTMTGYWKLNLKLLNESGDVLKGEDITETNLSSSLYLEIEF
ncbi:hypothetical protein [Cellulophaga tyrosinoxydans]|uniref:YtkA-like n=1 Tax=Cellulophaga tyrosinoxydans TaxID=504486 RepID=A0A1W2A244_9FLAO|nr:hypothetical protein [Cellulophaga tyrosinoxydans]SMC54501.1 hypothetical protein SAMN05660703_1719 [Cellulophaga tyrosinoxydans]